MQLSVVPLSVIPLNDPALWLAIVAGLAAIMSFLFIGSRSKQPRTPVALPEGSGSPDWEAPFAVPRHDERRRSFRRVGLPTEVLIVELKDGRSARASEAYVLDRSSGGLRVAYEKPVAVGSTMLAKPANAPEGFEWVRITVRSCREAGDYYELGCQFESELEISRLLMFG